eukprot:3125872-Amphidinium_carterae.1
MRTSRVVSLPWSMASDLDGALGYTCNMDGVIRPHDLEVAPPPALVLQPQDLPPSPPIISHMSLPGSPRNDLGGEIGYAVDYEGFWFAIDLDPVDLDPVPAFPPQLARFLESGLATFLPDQFSHSGGTISISVDHGLLSFVDSIDPRLTLAEWKQANDLTKRDLFWQGAKLDPAITLERRSATALTVTLVPRMWHEGEQP